MMGRADNKIIQRLNDNNYNEADLVEIKVPLSLPYSPSQQTYERWDGEIEYNGTHYNNVKRRICNDTLYVLCIPNKNKSLIHSAQADYSKQVNDIPAPGKKSNDSAAKKYGKNSDCLQWTADNILKSSPPLKAAHLFIQPSLNNSFIDFPGQPPEATV